MIRGQAGQSIGAMVLDRTTGAPYAGAVTCYVTIDNGVQALGSVAAGVCTAKGNGEFDYFPSAAETDGLNVRYTFVGATAINVTVNVPMTTPAQASALQTATGSVATPTLTLIKDALFEVKALQPGDDPSPDLTDFVLGKLNRLFDGMNANPAAAYMDALTDLGALTPSLQPHTWGPNAATFATTIRPEALRGANIIVGSGTTAYRYPLNLWDADRWRQETVQGITSSIPWAIYMAPDWPNASLYLWPVPTAAYHLEVQHRKMINQMVLADIFWMPPGYRNMVTLTLAESLHMLGAVSDETKEQAKAARADTFLNNLTIPRVRSVDGGMPTMSDSPTAGTFDWRTGLVR